MAKPPRKIRTEDVRYRPWWHDAATALLLVATIILAFVVVLVIAAAVGYLPVSVR